MTNETTPPEASETAQPETPEPAAAPAPEPDYAALLAEKDAEIAELKDRLLRQIAESENMRRRLEKEKADANVYALRSFARDLLAVADNLGRALQSMPPSAADDPALKNVLVGVEMTEKELMSVFQRFGILRIEAEGQKLDPNRHQAMAEVEHGEVPPGHVVQVFQAGFTIKDQLLRPAMVTVAKAGAGSPKVDTTA
jgi:molecular chaperone GrpE